MAIALGDSSGFYAALVPRDNDHERARAFLRQGGLTLHTTTAVVGETYGLLLRRTGYTQARNWVRAAQASPTVVLHHLNDQAEDRVWAIVEEYAGIPLSYVDAGLILVGRRLGLAEVFGFDSDYVLAGLSLVPGR